MFAISFKRIGNLRKPEQSVTWNRVTSRPYLQNLSAIASAAFQRKRAVLMSKRNINALVSSLHDIIKTVIGKTCYFFHSNVNVLSIEFLDKILRGFLNQYRKGDTELSFEFIYNFVVTSLCCYKVNTKYFIRDHVPKVGTFTKDRYSFIV